MGASMAPRGSVMICPGPELPGVALGLNVSHFVSLELCNSVLIFPFHVIIREEIVL